MNKSILNAIIISGLAVTLPCCSPKTDKAAGSGPNAERAETVEIMTVKKQIIAQKIDLSTTLQGYETVNISPSITGNIEHIYVEVGSKVKKGDTLVVMDRNQYNTTKLSCTNLLIEYKRIKELRETETVSQQSYDQAELNYKQTKENLEYLTDNTFIKARIPGVISAKNYEDGELYSGTPILTLTQIHLLKAVISIPESYFPMVKVGMKLNLLSDIYPSQTFPATIEIVYPTIDESTHTFQARLKIPNQNEKLRPGMFVRTTLEVGEIDAIMVPYESVLRLAGTNERYIFIDEDGVAKRIGVTLGQRYDEMVQIISDELKEGDQLVTVGQEKLISGRKVEVAQ